MPHDLTDFDKGRIVAFRNMGLSYKVIGERLHLTKSTVSSFLLRYRRDGNLLINRRENCGRNRVTDRQTDRFICDYGRRHRFESCADVLRSITNDLQERQQIIPSRRTVARRIFRNGLKSRTPASKCKLTEIHKLSRLLWAQNHENWLQEWDDCIFSDEAEIIMGRFGLQFVRRYSGERYDEKCIKTIPNRSTASVSIWAAISTRGITNLHFIEGRLNARRYVDDILAANLLPFCETHFDQNHAFTFQQDNSPVHTARIVRQWLTANNLNVMDWPSISPDINPIENVWGDLKKRLLKVGGRIHNSADLRAQVLLLWEQYRNERQFVITNCIGAMPTKCRILLQNNGSYLKY
jgi:transposase